jgi:LPS sulfotransferase NodH
MSFRVLLVRLQHHVSVLSGRIRTAGIERSFFLCSTPRTGSTMLGNMLAETGLVGRAGEYFGETFRREVVPGLTRAGFDGYLVGCLEHARGTGSFGLKLHWDQVEVFVHHLRLRRGLRGASDAEVIAAIFPSPRYVFLTREDTLAQAVSWWKAMTSGKWTDGRPITGAAAFDYEGIEGRVKQVEAHNERWRRWFAANGVEPLELSYESVAANPGDAVRRVLDHIGVEVPADVAIQPRTERQSDAVNEDWIRRYRELADARSVT